VEALQKRPQSCLVAVADVWAERGAFLDPRHQEGPAVERKASGGTDSSALLRAPVPCRGSRTGRVGYVERQRWEHRESQGERARRLVLSAVLRTSWGAQWTCMWQVHECAEM